MFETGILEMIGQGILETLYMTLGSTLFAYLFGLPMGILLVVTEPGGIHPKPVFNRVLGFAINILRSIPFIILLLAVIL